MTAQSPPPHVTQAISGVTAPFGARRRFITINIFGAFLAAHAQLIGENFHQRAAPRAFIKSRA
jgi:hypothetical protein